MVNSLSKKHVLDRLNKITNNFNMNWAFPTQSGQKYTVYPEVLSIIITRYNILLNLCFICQSYLCSFYDRVFKIMSLVNLIAFLGKHYLVFSTQSTPRKAVDPRHVCTCMMFQSSQNYNCLTFPINDCTVEKICIFFTQVWNAHLYCLFLFFPERQLSSWCPP